MPVKKRVRTNIKTILEKNLAEVHRMIAAACHRSGRQASDVTLVAVTKYVNIETVQALYELGVRDFGESRPQSLWEKQPALPNDCRWHLIGHWQTNKVRRTLLLVSIVHSIDRLPLAELVSDEAVRIGQKIPALIEVKLVPEEAKHGFWPESLRTDFEKLIQLPGLSLQGLMCMASLAAEKEDCRLTFRALRELRDELVRTRSEANELKLLSMGMSDDFEVAIEEGATHIRVGSRLFEGIES